LTCFAAGYNRLIIQSIDEIFFAICVIKFVRTEAIPSGHVRGKHDEFVIVIIITVTVTHVGVNYAEMFDTLTLAVAMCSFLWSNCAQATGSAS
jgi:hypothetical protein